MDFILVFAIGAVLVATGITSPKPKDDELAEEVKAVETEVVPIPEPEPAPAPEPASETELTIEGINEEQAKEEAAKPEEPELKAAQGNTDSNDQETGWLNIILYVLGAITVIAAGVYFFMRREPKPETAAEFARQDSNDQKLSESPQEEETQSEPAQEETQSEPAQEETQSEPAQEETQSEPAQEETTEQSSSNNDEENNK